MPLLKVLQKKLDGTPESLSEKELRTLVVPILAAEGLLTHCDLSLGRKVELRFIPGIENPADVLTKPRDVSLLSELFSKGDSTPVLLECGAGATAGDASGVQSFVQSPATDVGESRFLSPGASQVGEINDSPAEGSDDGPPCGEGGKPLDEHGGGELGALDRATRTGYGLRPSSSLVAPDRLVYFVSEVIKAVMSALPGSFPSLVSDAE
jgi:hypothetical protein